MLVAIGAETNCSGRLLLTPAGLKYKLKLYKKGYETMMKLLPYIICAALVTGFAFVFVLPSQARAEETSTSKTQHQLDEQKRQHEVQAHKEEAIAQAKEKRAEQKHKTCEKRQDKITGAMTRISNRGQKQLEVFTKISDRVQKFYAGKGKILENYDDLAADANEKKAAAAAALEAIKVSPQNFSCDNENPKEHTQAFKQNHKIATDALKAYKTAVKNLIVGVKSVQSTVVKEERGGNEQ
jgi:hypothetical protein